MPEEKQNQSAPPTKPAKDSSHTKLALIITAVVIVTLIVIAITTSVVNNAKETPTATQVAEISRTVTPTPKPNFVFDVPSLVGKNIDEVREILGQPIDAEKNLQEPSTEQKSLGITEWDNTFKKDGNELLITFYPDTRKVKDLFLAGDDKSTLLIKGNLKENDSRYKVETVKALKDPSIITGIIITPL